MKKVIIAILSATVLGVSLMGCKSNTSSSNTYDEKSTSENASSSNNQSEVSNISIQFGENGETFVINMYNNSTAVELAKSLGTSGMNLPIYNYDDFDGYEYFQYYDIPSRYNIPSNPETITYAKAGELYYSDPNRVILFYQDAEINGEYTRVGYMENTEGLKEAVEDNPVLQGWGNKLILLKPAN